MARSHRQEDHNKYDQLQDKSRNQISVLQETEPQTKLYLIHLKCAHCCNGMWQRTHNSINSRSDDIMDTLHQKLNNGDVLIIM